MRGTVLVFFSVSGVVLLINSYGLGKGCHNLNFKRNNNYGYLPLRKVKKPKVGTFSQDLPENEISTIIFGPLIQISNAKLCMCLLLSVCLKVPCLILQV